MHIVLCFFFIRLFSRGDYTYLIKVLGKDISEDSSLVLHGILDYQI